MNNRGMLFLLLGVVLAAMILIVVNRPQVETVASGGAEQAAAPIAGTNASVSVPSTSLADAGRGDAVPAVSDAPAVPVQTSAPGVNVVQGTPPSIGTASTDTPPATPDRSAGTASVETLPVSSGGSGTLALSTPSGSGVGTPTPARSTPPADTLPARAGGAENLEMTTSPRVIIPTVPTEPITPPTPSVPGGAGQTARPIAPQTQPRVDPNAEHSLSIMALRFSGQGMILKIEAEDAFTCKSIVLSGPDRLVVDLNGTWKNMRAPMVPDNTLVMGARTGRQEKAARLVLDLFRPLKKYETVRISPFEVEIHME